MELTMVNLERLVNNMTRNELRVLSVMLYYSVPESHIYITQKEVSLICGIEKSYVSKTYKSFLNLGLIVKDTSAGGIKTVYKFSEALSFRKDTNKEEVSKK